MTNPMRDIPITRVRDKDEVLLDIRYGSTSFYVMACNLEE